MKFSLPKQLAAAAALSGAALALSSTAMAVPFAPVGDFATFTFGFANFTTSTNGMQVGDTWTLSPTAPGSVINPVGGGEFEFEALDGETPILSDTTLTFDTGFANAGFEFIIDFDRVGIAEPVGPAGAQTGTLTFTIAETTVASVTPLGVLNFFQLAGIGLITTPDVPYQSPQPFSYIASGTIGSTSDTFSGSFSFSSPPDPAVFVSEPATLVLFGAGLLGMGFVARRRRMS